MIDPVLQRKMFSPKQEEMVDQGAEAVASVAEGQGITSGLVEMADEAQRIVDSVDESSDYEQLMNALREEPASMADRVGELAEVVGDADANKTPESVLAFMQPYFGLLETVEKGSQMQQDPTMGVGITAGLVDEPMQAPGQQEAMMRMAMGEQPVMRKDGSDEEGESVPAGFNIDAYKQIMGMVPEPTGYDEYLKQYKDLLGSDATGYETAPYLSGLQLAAAIANAPKGELLSRVLDPTTISAVADPILQAAQAKAKQDQAIKLKAAEAASASKTAAQESKSRLLETFASEALKSPDLQIFGSDALGQYAVDPRNPNKIITLKEGLGQKKTPFGSDTIGYYLLNDDNTVTTLKEGLGRKPDVFGNAETGFFYLDENNSVVTAKEGVGPDKQIFGNAEFGFYSYNPEDGTSSVLRAGTGPEAPEFVQLIKRFNDQKAIVDNPASTTDAIAKAQQELIFLSGKLTPSPQGTEFERLLQAGKDKVYAQTEGTEAEKLAAANKFEANALENYITSKTTPNLQYNPRKSIDDVFAKMLGEDITKINENVSKTAELENFSRQIMLASEGFETGAFASTRLGIQKVVRAFPGLDEFIKEGVSPETYKAVMGGDPVLGEIGEQASKNFALRLTQFIPGNLNAEEVALVIGAGPSLYTTKEGLQAFAEIYQKAADRARNEQAFVTKWMQTNSQKYPNAEDKYIALNQARSAWLAENPVVDIEKLNNLPSAELGGDIKGIRVLDDGSEVEMNLDPRGETMAKFVSSFDSYEKFKANAGQLISMGVLKDPNGRPIRNMPTEDSLKKLWNDFRGYRFGNTQ